LLWPEIKKSRTKDVLIQDVPFLPLESCCPVFFAEKTGYAVQAGLLTSGSTSSRAFPFPCGNSGKPAEFVPGYSGGPVPEYNRIPFSSVETDT
jgi:hypothetical protein